jgi:DNA-binding LacI/PurR family transcriptional regulator
MNFKNTIILLNRPEEHFLESFYFQKIKSGINEAIAGTDYQLLLSQQDTKLPEVISSKDCKMTGFINIAPHVNHSSLKLLAKSDLPSVLINCRVPGLSWVDVDNVHGAMTMTEHLISLGHEKILFVGGFEDAQNSIDRLKGFKEALSKHKIRFNPRLALTCDFSVTLAYERMKEFLFQSPKWDFTAAFVANDMMAVGIIRALADENIKVPENVAIVGFDDFDFAPSFYVPITTYRQPFHNLGFVAAKTLIKQIETGETKIQQTELIGELVIRDSCGSKQRSK